MWAPRAKYIHEQPEPGGWVRSLQPEVEGTKTRGIKSDVMSVRVGSAPNLKKLDKVCVSCKPKHGGRPPGVIRKTSDTSFNGKSRTAPEEKETTLLQNGGACRGTTRGEEDATSQVDRDACAKTIAPTKRDVIPSRVIREKDSAGARGILPGTA